MASNAIVEMITARGCITKADVATMRRAYYADASITQGEVSELMVLNETCASQTKLWTKFFAETIANFILQQTAADGSISKANAQWLASRSNSLGERGAAEREVFRLIKQQSSKVGPALKPLLELVA